MPKTAAYVDRKSALAWLRKGLFAAAAASVVFVFLFVQTGAQAAGPDPNEIVTENALPGNAPSEWEVSRGGRPEHPGLRDGHQRRPGRDGRVQDRHDRRRTTGSTSTGSASTAATARARSRRSSRRRRCRRTQPSCLVLDGTLRRQPVDCGNWGVSASWSVPTDAVSGIYIATPVREDVGGDLASHIAFIVRDDDGELGPPVPDLGHDLAGVQPVRRLQPLRRSRARPQGQLQPPLHDARCADRGLAVQRRVPDAPLARAQRLRRQLLHRRRFRSARRPRSSSTRPSCRSATTSTGRPDSARTSRRPATRASTSPSSAATRSTGRPAGSRAPPTAGAPTTGRSSRTRRATPRAPSTTTAPGTSAAIPTRTPGPASGGRTRRATTADVPRTGCPARSAGATRRPRSRSRPPPRPCASGATPA